MATGTGQIREDELPGIGRRFTFDLPDEQQVCVVIHHTGRRDIYVSSDPDQDARVVTLEDDDARRLGAVVGGSYFSPAAVQRVEAAIGGLLIDWVTVRDDSSIAGKSIAEAEIRRLSRITVAAVVRGDESIIAPDPDEVIQPGDQLVVMGRAEHLPEFVAQFIR